jgi:hypothetical protein
MVGEYPSLLTEPDATMRISDVKMRFRQSACDLHMRHPSRWPWLLRFPLYGLILILIWWGPIALLWNGMIALKIEGSIAVLLGIGMLIGWSGFIMKTVVHPLLEPFFNLRSTQNPHKELFTPEPIYSFRDLLRVLFVGR